MGGLYRNDVRLLRLWVQYADCLPDPGDVFAFLREAGVGQGHALFHIAHATYLELRGAFAAADAAYARGLAAGAAPAERLRAKFDEFQHRMARRIARKAAEQAAGGGEEGEDERPSLAVLGGRRRGAGLGTQKRKAVATPVRGNAPAGGALEVFVDAEFGGAGGAASAAAGGAGGAGMPIAGGTAGGASGWAALPAAAAARKENALAALTWAGQRLQPAAAAPSPAPTLEIPVDPEFAADAAADAARAAAAPAPASLRQRLDHGGLPEALAADPLRLHRVPPAVAAPAAPPTRREEVMGFDESLLAGAGGRERCFEEARAEAWLARRADAEEADAAERAAAAAAEQRARAAAAAPRPPLPTPFDQGVPEPAPLSAAARGALDAVAASFRASSSDVTLNTRGAFDAVNAMFGARLPSAGAALAPLLDAGSGAAAAERRPGSGRVAEPTMTINTRDALSTVNSMFGAPLAQASPFDEADCAPPGAAFGGDASDGGGAPAGGLEIREDTVFFGHGGAGGSPLGGGLMVREDTMFVGAAAAALAGRGEEAGDETAPLGAREDTQYVGLPAAAEGGRDTTLQLRAGGGAWAAGAAAGADETVVVARGALDDAGNAAAAAAALPPASAPRPQGSTGLTADLENVAVDAAADDEHSSRAATRRPATFSARDDYGDENSEPSVGGCRHAARDIRDASVAASALRPLAGTEVEEDAEAEAALAAGGSAGGAPLGEDFEVWDDGSGEAGTSEDCSDGAAGQINPFAPGFQAHVLAMLEPPVEAWPGVGAMDADDEAAARGAFRAATRGAPADARLGGAAYRVLHRIGEGAYAQVYAATDAASGADVALKVEAPACPWEWYVLRAVQGRVPAAAAPLFPAPSALALGPGASVLAMPRGVHGSLQDLLNHYLAAGRRPEQPLALHLVAALCRALGALHAARVLHNDVKPDNVLVVAAPPGRDENAPALGLQLIDFGRAVDLELLPPGAALGGDSGVDAFRCVAMREGRPWTFEGDAYGAAGVAHCLLFGRYMEVERAVDDATGAARVRLAAPLRRYWDADLWGGLFDALLNHGDLAAPPPWGDLAARLEARLDGDREAGCALRVELARLGAALGADHR